MHTISKSKPENKSSIDKETASRPASHKYIKTGESIGMPKYLQRSSTPNSPIAFAQRQPLEEEEEAAQMKSLGGSIQRQPLEEEEEELQTKPLDSTLQRQTQEEDEEVQAKTNTKPQAKLTVSQPDDPYEQEADRVADRVMRMPITEVSRQPMEEEEELQTKADTSNISNSTLQRQEEDDEEEEEEQPILTKTLATTITPLVQRQVEEEEEEPLQAKRSGKQNLPTSTAITSQIQSLKGRGEPLDSATRGFFENRFGEDFTQVRVHHNSQSADVASAINAKAFTTGNNIVFNHGAYSPSSHQGKQLMAHELTHVIQQRGLARKPLAGKLQRRVWMYVPPASSRSWATWREMNRTQRRRFVNTQFRTARRADRNLALRIIEDMAAASDPFRFSSDAELKSEIQKRVYTSRFMRESQITVSGRRGFGYPFTRPSQFWGPRVNYAAKDYWQPPTPDNYSLRRDQARRRRLLRLPRHQRHTVFGDQGRGYRFTLTRTGRADPYEAIIKLFPRQRVHRRTLVHCDYLVSLVHFKAFAETIGRAEFNRRVRAYGAHRIVFRYDLFSYLEVPLGATTRGRPLGSLQYIRPSSEANLVIGDHVFFFNHQAYDLINKNIGNAWRLENAVLIDRRGGRNIFLGHGSGQRNASQLRSKLAREYNDVVNIALGIIARTRRGSPASRARAMSEMGTRFPNIHRHSSGRWYVAGYLRYFGITGAPSRYYSQWLRTIRPNEVVGLKDPTNTAVMYWVRRPVESR